jgi:hypothetical protein
VRQADGREEEVQDRRSAARRALQRLSVAIPLALLFSILVVVPAQANHVVAKVVRYGPYSIPAGTDTDPGMINNKLFLSVRKPCVDCYITSFKPDLVYGDGTQATMATGPMLHHFVLANQFRRDATCGNQWLGLFGERFFASGNERTPIAFPNGYGYRVRWYDSWNLLVDLMNHSTTAKTVYIQVTYTYRPSWESVKRLKPVWLDIDQCGDSEYSIPAGFSDTHRDWSVTVPGKVVAMIGHLHGHGVAIEATNESQGGASLCKSNATLDPSDVHSVRAMSTCSGDPLAILHQGDVVRLHSMYQSSHPADDVMGIMLGYVNPS